MHHLLSKRKLGTVITSAAIILSSIGVMQNSALGSAAVNGLIYLDQGSTNALAAFNANGTTGTVIQPLTSQCAKYPSFSLDGSKVAWVDGCTGTSLVKVSNTDGSNEITVATVTSTVNRPALSPDGATLYFVTNMGTDIYKVDATVANATQTGTAMQIGNNSDPFSVSSTGKIAYIANNNSGCGNGVSGVFVRTISGTGPGTFVPGSCSTVSGVQTYSEDVTWSADGAKMYISQRTFNTNTSSRGKPTINRFTEAGIDGATFFEHSTAAKVINSLSISPDGTKLAFTISDQNWSPESASILDLSTQVATQIIPTLNSRTRTIIWAPQIASAATTTTVPAVTTTVPAVTTTVALKTTSTTTTVPKNIYATVVPGVTVTDTKVYEVAPKRVAGNSAIVVLSDAQNKISDVVSKTPSVCLPNDNDLVFIDEGRCIAEVVNIKSRKVLRTLKTTVVADDISELKVGNEVAILTPLYFIAASFDLKPESLSRLTKLKDRVASAGSVLVAGHSGILMGNTPENVKLAKARADATVALLKARGAKGPFAVASVGALDPVTNVQTRAAQDKNRRVVIVLIP